MKGSILLCLKEMTIEKYNEKVWQNAAEEYGLATKPFVIPGSDVPDEKIIGIIKNLGRSLDITLTQIGEDFGAYWMTTYAPRVYTNVFKDKQNSRDFLLTMDEVHKNVTKTVPNAMPPHFTYQWENTNTLIMTYNSPRGLIEIFTGLAKGVGRYYHEELNITTNGNQLKIIFPN